MSTLAIWSRVVQSRDVQFRDFSVPVANIRPTTTPILGFIVSCRPNLTFIRLIDVTTAIVFKPIVNTKFLCNFNDMALESIHLASPMHRAMRSRIYVHNIRITVGLRLYIRPMYCSIAKEMICCCFLHLYRKVYVCVQG